MKHQILQRSNGFTRMDRSSPPHLARDDVGNRDLLESIVIGAVSVNDVIRAWRKEHPYGENSNHRRNQNATKQFF
jgi:hypothetical protein